MASTVILCPTLIIGIMLLRLIFKARREATENSIKHVDKE